MMKHQKSKSRLQRATGAVIDTLEKRQLLTTLIGGQTFDYQDADGKVIRILAEGNITVHFAGLQVHPGSTNPDIPAGETSITDLRPPGTLPPDQAPADLYRIVIESADEDSMLAIAELDNDGNMVPFTGSRQIDFRNIGPDQGVQNIGSVGGVFIGGTDLADNIVPLFAGYDGSINGVSANGDGNLEPGIEIADGVSIGKILIGGIVTNEVIAGGSIDTFYAGALLTGNVEGLGRNADPNDPDGDPNTDDSVADNFFVAGDLRNLLIGESIGTNQLEKDRTMFEREYNTGVDIKVMGRIGQIITGVAVEGGSFYGSARAEATRPNTELTNHIFEVEGKLGPGVESYFEFGLIGDDSIAPGLDNDSFATPQYLHTYFDAGLNENDVAVVEGSLDFGETDDFYGLPLLAGQTVSIDMDISAANAIVLDPDGRPIASDYSHVNGNLGGDASLANEAFQFTAEKPGVYRIQINAPVTQAGDYSFIVRGAADINFGAIEARTGSVFTDQPNVDSISVIDGDLGLIAAADNIVQDFGANRFFVSSGNLRAMVAASIGYIDTGINTITGGPSLHVRNGSVGLLQSTGTDLDEDVLMINAGDAVTTSGSVNRTQAVGVDIQAVITATDFDGDLIAKRSIGLFRAPNLHNRQAFGTGAPFFVANSDNKGSDGIIGLIDVPGVWGNISEGGAAIDTGSGGNVIFMNIGGTVFKDRFFGSSSGESVTAPVDSVVTLTDDSGTDMTLIPFVQAAGGGGFGQPVGSGSGVTRGTLTYTAYPIRSTSGARAGVVLVRVSSTTGLRITSNPRGGNAVLDIGTITVNGNGRQVRKTASTTSGGSTFQLVGTTSELAVRLDGTAPINVLNITHNEATSTTGRFSDINNSTTGSLLNIDARSIGRLEAENIGVPMKLNGVALLPDADRVLPVQPTGQDEELYPFLDQRISVNISGNGRTTFRETGTAAGNVISIKARKALGNIVIDGSVDLVQANSDKAFTPGVFEGIVGPVLLYGEGEVDLVDIGEGLAHSGTGAFADSGIFAEGTILKVGNQGIGSDIRGDIVSKTEITEISLTDGAIINNDIAVILDFNDTIEIPDLFFIPENTTDTIENPLFEIGEINLKGVGGIIGSYIRAADIGPVTIDGGFGVISSTFQNDNSSVIAGVTTGGYGIRSSAFDAGQRLQSITVSGDGARLSTNSYTPSVRISSGAAFDPFTNRPPSKLSDLHVFLGTTADAPKRKGVSNAGVIADSEFIGSRDILSMSAWQIQARNPFDFFGAPIPFTSPSFPMRINFGNAVGTIRTRSDIVGLALSSGGLDNLLVSGAVDRTSLGISGRVENIDIGGTFRGTSTLVVTGPEGALVNMRTGGSLFGQVNVALGVGATTVGGDFGSPSFLVTRNIDNLTIAGDVLTGSRIRTKRTLVNLDIGGDVQAGASITAKVISNQSIDGDVFGNIVITG